MYINVACPLWFIYTGYYSVALQLVAGNSRSTLLRIFNLPGNHPHTSYFANPGSFLDLRPHKEEPKSTHQ